MNDIFRAVFFRPADSSLFRDAKLVVVTPTGSVEDYPIVPKVWREVDDEQAIRDFVEDRLIRAFPARKTMWHGSVVTHFDLDAETGAAVCIVHVESDHYDGGYRPHEA